MSQFTKETVADFILIFITIGVVGYTLLDSLKSSN